MLRLNIIVIALLACAGCDSFTDDHQQRLLDSLANPREAIFSESKTYPGKVLCGRYKSVGIDGYSTVNRRYIVTPDTVRDQPGDDELAVFCADDPEQALYTRLGIGSPEDRWDDMITVHDDIRTIEGAVLQFFNTRHALPRRLDALLEAENDLAADTLLDPWGRSYVYDEGLSGRSAPRYALGSLGADGQAGGQGVNADISLKQLSLLEHVFSLRGLR